MRRTTTRQTPTKAAVRERAEQRRAEERARLERLKALGVVVVKPAPQEPARGFLFTGGGDGASGF